MPFQPARVLLFFLLTALSACKPTPPHPPAAPEPQPAKQEAPVPPPPKPPALAGIADLSQRVEALTGAHTRAVWSMHTGTGSPDPFANGSAHQLWGIDTRDGRGVRVILDKRGNYSRPLLSPDGTIIFYTNKLVEREPSGLKHFNMNVMRTDWAGTSPVAVFAGGQSVATWSDPDTGRDWLYAVADIPPSERIAWAAKRLVRMPLDDFGSVETVWDQTPVSPDNIQFSADGRRACLQTPWPNGGQLTLEGGRTGFFPTDVGCWAGMAPDNSYISWMLDGGHRGLVMHAPAAVRKTWRLEPQSLPSLEKGEIYHPRWSNHPRFITLTGPYIPEKDDKSEGSAISKGGRTAEVIIARVNDTLTAFEDAVVLTKNEHTDAFPDLWIEGGRGHTLSAFPQGLAHEADKTSAAWPGGDSQPVFLWERFGSARNTLNRDGRILDCSLNPLGAAVFGRLGDALTGTGAFSITDPAAESIQRALSGSGDWRIEFTLVRDPVKVPSPRTGSLISTPHLRVALEDNYLLLNGAAMETPRLSLPVHICLVRAGGSVSAFIDGRAHPGQPLPPLENPGSSVRIGDGTLDAGLLGLAIFDQVSDPADIAASAAYWHQRMEEAKANPPPRVRLKAKLLETSPPPDPEGITPYTRAMVSNLYEVVEVLEGDYKERQIIVNHWALMDEKPASTFPNQAGALFELLAEPVEFHPELNGQRAFSEHISVFDLDFWYDIMPPTLPK